MKNLIFIFVFMFVPHLWAQTFLAVSDSGYPEQITRWPLLELPFNGTTTYAWPSMQQSLLLSSSMYQTVHTLIERHAVEQNLSSLNLVLMIGIYDILSEFLPLGNSWMHEEWHRAVMTQHHIGSQNDVYKFKLFVDSISVSHVQDDDLIRLKAEAPADLVRLSAAGMEAQTEQNLYLEKARFFDRSPSHDGVVLWSNVIGNWAYIHTCNSPDSTQQTLDGNDDDGSDISKRDFTGLDCLGWVYDLFRPDEPYSARGPHPSGVGINRYRTLEDLTDDEKSFLRKQDYLSALAVVDPFLFGFPYFRTEVAGEPLEWNAKLQHFLTSFGYDIDAVLFFRHRQQGYLVKLHQYFNTKRYFPGVSLELNQWPWTDKISLTPSLSIWQQPENQRFDDLVGKWAGALDLMATYKLNPQFQPFVYGTLKGPGWKAGDAQLESGYVLGIGLNMVF